ncbi:MAG: glycosyltransferase [Myxococcota bacterium]|nr:glycosyltransferase [Myxococcota bacterium]
MSIIVLDPGCIAQTSHNVAINIAIHQHCTQRNTKSLFFLNEKSEADIHDFFPSQSVFRSGIIYNGIDDPLLPFGVMFDSNRWFADDLKQHVSPILQRGDIVVIHTVTCYHLLGLLEWYEEVQHLDIRLNILFRFSPVLRMSAESNRLHNYLYKYALERWSACNQKNVRFLTDSDALAKYYNRAKLVPFASSAIPIDFSFFKSVSQKRVNHEEGIHWMFLGEHRPEKGSMIIFDAINAHVQSFPNDRFTLQIPSGELLSPEIYGEHFSFILGPLKPKEYYQWLEKADAVFVCYDPIAYRLRTSHIFVEALGFGIPTITTEKSWMHLESNRLRNGGSVLMKQFDSVSLFRAMNMLRRQYNQYKQAAETASERVRTIHNIQAFVQALVH